MTGLPLTITSQLAREPLPVTGERQLAYLLVEVRASESAGLPLPLNLSLVLDRSSSMRGPRLSAVKDAIGRVVDLLTPDDTLSIVTFDDMVDLVAPAQPVSDPESLKAAAALIEEGGGTAMSLGMSLGLAELSKVAAPERASRMILLTDGTTRGDAGQCERLATEAGAVGVTIVPLGCGAEWDDTLLEAIAAKSGGPPPDYLRTAGEIAPGFARHTLTAREIMARGVTAEVRFVAGVMPRRVTQVAPFVRLLDSAIDDRSLTVLLGDVPRLTPHALLIELLIEPKRGGTFRVAQIEVKGPGESEPVRADVVVVFSASAAKRPQVRPIVLHYVERAVAARLVLRALADGETARPTFAPSVLDLFESEAREQLDALIAGRSLSPEGRKALIAHVRELTGARRSLVSS